MPKPIAQFTARQVKRVTAFEGLITAQQIRQAFDLHPSATLMIDVPGGGNWSAMALSLDEDVPGIKVEWEERE